ncbi:hypothetical protein W97_04482 [Coniosporium apollinis CBS 100218]|uniref:Serine/threonine-protein kinase MEC1 n=1 Tax=Coniosporium apollinis (strain CBS 100218) TaxID=1168221 RepID=R7YTM8_CONA1|nr:uncharacterized protein W97_04482 [Coniosporium apollinis CBS 100218]EON65245.1 hypothetical protein W97_04482 [Coniosporium apollinis CBS 100218]
MRRQKELTQHAVTNGLSANGIPPPSTIAAQIVQHQSNANARREPENRALFGKLLQEYLNDPAAEESDAHINARLIHVIAEAGLDVLHKENPFAQELLVPQAIKSIAVITLVIQRYPKILLFVEPAGNHGTARSRSCVSNTVEEYLHSAIFEVVHDERSFGELTKELQVILCLWIMPAIDMDRLSDSARSLCTVLASQSSLPIDDAALANDASAVFSHTLVSPQDQERPAKRQRTVGSNLSQPSAQGSYKSKLAELCQLFKRQSTDDLTGLHQEALQHYSELAEKEQCEEQCKALTIIGYLPCGGSGSLQRTHSSIGTVAEKNCTVCDCLPGAPVDRPALTWDGGSNVRDWNEIMLLLSEIMKSTDFQRSKKPRILATIAIRRIINHTSNPEMLDLANSQLGQWCLRSFHSSLRELRIAAGRALTAFLRNEVQDDVRRQNRIFALEFLKTLSEMNQVVSQEALVLAYAQVALACGHEELNIVLLSLVEYLGHTNSLISGVAFNQLCHISAVLGCQPADLLKPFWRSVGITVVKDLNTRPQKAQELSDFLEVSVTQLLLLTQTDTLPYLVLTKKHDVLQRIASARGPATSVQDICTQPRKNLAAIVALLLLQSSPDSERYTMDLLCEAAPGLKDDLSGLIELEPVLIACEILKAADEEDTSKKSRVRQAIQTLATISERKNGQSKAASKQSRLVSTFFESHILGMMAHFSEVIDNSREPHPASERVRCLRAIEAMTALAKTHVSVALPQIRTCLQSAMEDDKLRYAAFSAWVALMSVAEEEDVDALIDHTFAMIAQHWSSLNAAMQRKTYDMLSNLLKAHNVFFQERIGTLPLLPDVPLLSKHRAEIARLKALMDPATIFSAFSQRCEDESSAVVEQALRELVPFLVDNQRFIHETSVSQQPNPVVAQLLRSLLDAVVRFNENHSAIIDLCSQCLGLVGCLNPYRVEAAREKQDTLVLSNFERADEIIDFSAVLLPHVLVPAFRSASNAKSQGFLAYTMQEMLKYCGYGIVATQRTRSSQASSLPHQRWLEMPEAVRSTLTPFLSSRYMVTNNNQLEYVVQKFPIFNAEMSHGSWLRTFVYDLLQRGKGHNAQRIFSVLARVIKGYDLSIASFMLPFAAANVILGGDNDEALGVRLELLIVLKQEMNGTAFETETIRQCSESVFRVLDYLSRWLQEKRGTFNDSKSSSGRRSEPTSDSDDICDTAQISRVELVLQGIPAEVISHRAVECRSYARALFHWEQYIRQEREKTPATQRQQKDEALYQYLQDIYAQIEEPDGIEGISAHLHVLGPEQQVLEHQKAGRWAAAQSWYELELAEKPDDAEIQVNLLTCLKEAGQYDVLLRYANNFRAGSASNLPQLLPFASEASWVTDKWRFLEDAIDAGSAWPSEHFNVGVGTALLALRQNKHDDFLSTISALRQKVARNLSPSTTSSVQACHDQLLKLHALYEMEAISGLPSPLRMDREVMLGTLDRRLEALGTYTSDKQYLLGIRRATMQHSSLEFSKMDLASSWLTTSKLARKSDIINTAHNAVLHATQLGDDAARIEHARLLWKEGHHRKAIQSLEGAIAANAFQSHDLGSVTESMSTSGDKEKFQNFLAARAHVLLAKWLDASGQTPSATIIRKYQLAVQTHSRWEKGHYYLGKHYNKLLQSEKAMPRGKQNISFRSGETAKLVVDNFIRSMCFGAKYYYQTIPRLLTVWLDLGMDVHQATQHPVSAEADIVAMQIRNLDAMHRQIRKYAERLPGYIFYTAFPQIITRISHPNAKVWEVLFSIIIKVASAHPQQALWYILAVVKSSAADRSSRGLSVLNKLKKNKAEGSAFDMRAMITHGQKLSDQLLRACEAVVDGRSSHVSLSRDLGFNHKLAPCPLVVPIEATMTATLPTVHDSPHVRQHKAFSGGNITISSFSDDVLVLTSLQRPRKLVVRGSDGNSYGLLCKPKDDLRKDQRLMEFNAMINRGLQKDVEASKRRLYIKTYGVTPLNEECGTIEWVDNLKPMRDIIIKLYKQKSVAIDYNRIRTLLNESIAAPENISIFTDTILKLFFPVLYEWFIETFPEPDDWFKARLRYTRSCAVMSIVGHVLGLGDRHGENLLLEEGTGGILHVDFNCLFDKGLTFEKPEVVPFRLTHNMVDAMGAYGYEGPFRTAAELTLGILRQNEDTLMTILETFVYDPTTDFIGKKKRPTPGVPDTPQEVLESVRGKLAGLLRGESVPLSVEGYVEALIQMARDPKNLASMYIGWCAFF